MISCHPNCLLGSARSMRGGRINVGQNTIDRLLGVILLISWCFWTLCKWFIINLSVFRLGRGREESNSWILVFWESWSNAACVKCRGVMKLWCMYKHVTEQNGSIVNKLSQRELVNGELLAVICTVWQHYRAVYESAVYCVRSMYLYINSQFTTSSCAATLSGTRGSGNTLK